MSDEPVDECEVCCGAVERVLFPVAVHFKGSGFYTTDYAKKKGISGSGNGNGGDPEGAGGSGSESVNKKSSGDTGSGGDTDSGSD